MRPYFAWAVMGILFISSQLSHAQVSPTSHGAGSPLSVADVEHGLKAGVSNARMSVLVKQYGVDFELTDAIEKQLRAAGANNELLLRIARLDKPSVDSPSSTAELVKQANRYRLGDGVPVDENKAAMLYKKGAESGNAEAQTRYGEALFDGRGVTRDRTAAKAWFEKAAALKYARAEANLGVILLDGLGGPQDISRGIDRLQTAAQKGDGYSEALLGQSAQYGWVTHRRDGGEAYSHYLRAGELGYAAAFYNMGQLYRYGTGVTQDWDYAIKYFAKAASIKNPETLSAWSELRPEAAVVSHAMKVLGYIYKNGISIPKDDGLAEKWYQQAAELDRVGAEAGWAVGQNMLGVDFAAGLGVSKDGSQAMNWFQWSARQGNLEAQTGIAGLYRNGFGGPPDYAQALASYQAAAVDSLNTVASYNVGWIYESGGYGVNQDYAQALVWYRKAAEHGESYADFRIGALYEAGHGVSQSYPEAMAWYHKAAEEGYAVAKEQVGHLYEKGLGVPQSTEAARIWYQKAADSGDESAKQYLAALDRPTQATASESGSSQAYAITSTSGGSTPASGSTASPSSCEVPMPTHLRNDCVNASYERDDHGIQLLRLTNICSEVVRVEVCDGPDATDGNYGCGGGDIQPSKFFRIGLRGRGTFKYWAATGELQDRIRVDNIDPATGGPKHACTAR